MCLQFPRTVVMLEFNNVLHCTMVSLYLALGLRMERLPPNMSNGLRRDVHKLAKLLIDKELDIS